MKKIPILLLFVIICLSGNSQETGSVTDPRDGKIYKTVKIGNQWVMAQNLAYKPEKGNYWSDTTFFEKDSKANLNFDKTRTHYENGIVYTTVKSGDKINGAEVPRLFSLSITYGYLVFDSTKYFGKDLFDGYMVLDTAILKRNGYLYDFETAKSVAFQGWHVPTSDEWKELLKFLDGNAKSNFYALMEGGFSGFNAVLCGWGRYVNGRFKSRTITDCQGSLWSSSRVAHMATCLDFNGPPVLRSGAVRLGLIDLNTGLSVRLFKDK